MDELLALRIGALRLARRRGSERVGAWAASRVRLPGVVLDPADARFARETRLRLGRALRIARVRAERPPARATAPGRALERPSSRGKRVLGLLAAAVTVVALLLIAPELPAGDAGRSGGSPVAGGASQPSVAPLRGRSALVVAAISMPTPVPTEAPTSAPSATPTAAPTAPSTTKTSGGAPAVGGVPGAGAGPTGSGAPGGGTARATPTRSPAPPVDRGDLMTLRGRVVDARTNRGVPDVCVSIGVATCAPELMTDVNGFWTVSLTVGQILAWDIRFIKTGFQTTQIKVPSQPGTHNLPDIRLRLIR